MPPPSRHFLAARATGCVQVRAITVRAKLDQNIRCVGASFTDNANMAHWDFISVGMHQRPASQTTSENRKNRPLEFAKEPHGLYLARVDNILASASALDEPTRSALARARAQLEAEQWTEATWLFGEIALANQRDDAGMVAAMLYFEGLAFIYMISEFSRQDCLEEYRDRFPTLQRI